MAGDMLFEIKTIKGPREIKDSFSGEPGMEIDGWKWTIRQDKNLLGSVSGAANPSRATVGALEITKRVDIATPQLLQLCAKGGGPELTFAGIWCYQTIGAIRHPYYKIKLENPVIFSVEVGDSPQDGVSVEKVTLTFANFMVFSQPWDPLKKNVGAEVKSKRLSVIKGVAL